jgi:hypothetical protein
MTPTCIPRPPTRIRISQAHTPESPATPQGTYPHTQTCHPCNMPAMWRLIHVQPPGAKTCTPPAHLRPAASLPFGRGGRGAGGGGGGLPVPPRQDHFRHAMCRSCSLLRAPCTLHHHSTTASPLPPPPTSPPAGAAQKTHLQQCTQGALLLPTTPGITGMQVACIPP